MLAPEFTKELPVIRKKRFLKDSVSLLNDLKDSSIRLNALPGERGCFASSEGVVEEKACDEIITMCGFAIMDPGLHESKNAWNWYYSIFEMSIRGSLPTRSNRQYMCDALCSDPLQNKAQEQNGPLFFPSRHSSTCSPASFFDLETILYT